MEPKLSTGKDEKGRPVLRSTGPHKSTYRVYSSLSAARAAKKRIESKGAEAIREFHFRAN